MGVVLILPVRPSLRVLAGKTEDGGVGTGDARPALGVAHR